jgi:hypothetical protein
MVAIRANTFACTAARHAAVCHKVPPTLPWPTPGRRTPHRHISRAVPQDCFVLFLRVASLRRLWLQPFSLDRIARSAEIAMRESSIHSHRCDFVRPGFCISKQKWAERKQKSGSRAKSLVPVTRSAAPRSAWTRARRANQCSTASATCPASFEKIFCFSEVANHLYIPAVLSQQRGVAQRHRRGAWMRWTRMVLLTRVLEADGEDVWS